MSRTYREYQKKHTTLCIPKSRPPIRKIGSEETHFSSDIRSHGEQTKNSMYTSRKRRPNIFDNSANDASDTYDDDEDSIDVEDRIDGNESLDDSSEYDERHESCSSAHNSPNGIQFHRLTQSPNRSRSSSVAKNNVLRKSSMLQSRKDASKECKETHLFRFLAILIVVIAISLWYVHGNVLEPVNKSQYKELIAARINKARELNKILDQSIKKVQTQFNNQKANIWNDIASGIYDSLLYPERPSIIVLFGNETDVMNCLAQLLGQISGVMLGSNDYEMLMPRDFGNDLGEVIYNLKLLVPEKRAIVIQDLLSINTEALKAFHNLCDRENPLIGHAIYIITVIVSGYEPGQKELEFIETQISKSLSSKIEKDILDPLVTRITDGAVIPVLPEPAMKSCSFPL